MPIVIVFFAMPMVSGKLIQNYINSINHLFVSPINIHYFCKINAKTKRKNAFNFTFVKYWMP